MLQTPMPAAREIINAITQAFQGDILMTASASTNHKIGDNASKNINIISPLPRNIYSAIYFSWTITSFSNIKLFNTFENILNLNYKIIIERDLNLWYYLFLFFI